MSHNHIVFETEWFNIEQLHQNQPESIQGKPYYRMNAPDGVLVLALTEDNQVIVIEQFRPAINQHTLEIPAGSIDPGETPEEAAKRELLEETGYACDTLIPLGVGRLMASRLNSQQYCFLGRGAAPDPSFNRKEPIQVRLVSPKELKDLMLSGEFQQYTAFALLVLSDWRAGTSLTRP
jgi:8-oxo-dGTP pyrophosphatase MutT (NUDIX family)